MVGTPEDPLSVSVYNSSCHDFLFHLLTFGKESLNGGVCEAVGLALRGPVLDRRKCSM